MSENDAADEAADEAAEDVEEAVAADEAEETTEGGIQDGDFVRLHYTVRTQDDGRVIDTTHEDVAEEEGLTEDNPDYEFEPRVVVVGAGHVFPQVDDALVGEEEGATGTVEVPTEDAFGEYDQDEVRTVSAEKLSEDDRRPGAQVQVDGEQGFVETIIGGRARVDFNHPLAGEDLEYEYEVLDLVEDDEEKAQGLLGMYLEQVPEVRIEEETVEEEVTVEAHEDEETGEVERETETQEVEKRSLVVEATQQMQMNQQWMFQKQQIAQDLMDRLDLDRVVIEEVIEGGGGMGGMFGGMGGMGGGGLGAGDLEEELEDVDVDADEIAEELEDVDLEE